MLKDVINNYEIEYKIKCTFRLRIYSIWIKNEPDLYMWKTGSGGSGNPPSGGILLCKRKKMSIII